MALSFIGAYSAERDYTVWADLSTKLGEIDTLLSNSADAYPHFERFGLKVHFFCACSNHGFSSHLFFQLYSPVAHDLGWDAKPGEHHTAPMLRSLALVCPICLVCLFASLLKLKCRVALLGMVMHLWLRRPKFALQSS